jgi:hypothetical protein
MPDGVRGFVPGQGGSARHIELNLGNVMAIGFLSLLFYGTTDWVTAYLARKDIPVLSQVSVGAQLYLHSAAPASMS